MTGLAEQCTLPGGKWARVNGTRDKVRLPTEWRRFDVRGVGKHKHNQRKDPSCCISRDSNGTHFMFKGDPMFGGESTKMSKP